MIGALRQAVRRPGWVLPCNPDMQFDFARGTGWKGTGTGGGAVVPSSSLVTVTRASTAMIDDLKGQWRTFPAAVPARSDKGLAVWEARTNLALWCRDLTNAAWAKVTMTAALTATGIDGTANSATTITATGASSTILQTVVQASTADTVSFFVRRRTGTGTIEVTADGVAFTDITAALATAVTDTPGGWYRATVSATLVNPVFGLRITTSGDEVDVDFAQLEAGTFATSPILTTTVGVARAADVVVAAQPPTFGGSVTLYCDGSPSAAAAYATNQFMGTLSDGTTNNRLVLYRVATTATFNGLVTANGSNILNTQGGGSAWTQFVSSKGMVTHRVGHQAEVTSRPSATVGTASSATAFSAPLNKVNIGSSPTGTTPFNGYVANIAVWPITSIADEAMRDIVRR